MWFELAFAALFIIYGWGCFILGAKSVNQESFRPGKVEVFTENEEEEEYGQEEAVQP